MSTEPAQVLLPPPTDSCPECGRCRNLAYRWTNDQAGNYTGHYHCDRCDYRWSTSWLLSALGGAA